MTRMRLLVALLVCGVAWPASGGEKVRMAVLDLESSRGLDPDLVKLLNDMLLTEFAKDDRFDVIGQRDIAAMLSLEEVRVRVTGCADDSCLAEIGGALGVQQLVTASMGKVGEVVVINMKCLDVKRAVVLARANAEIKGDESELLPGIRDAVDEIKAQVRLPGDPDLIGPGDWLPWATLGLAAAAGAVGATMGGLALKHEADLENEPHLEGDREQVKTEALVADVMIGVAAAAAVATVVLFLVDLDGEERGSPPAASVVPVHGGAAASVLWRF